MLNANDGSTFLVLRELRKVIQESARPVVLWVGAGASKWLGYPLWIDLARDLRKEFFTLVSGFNNAKALSLIDSHANRLPEFFQLCKDLDEARYYRFLSEAFLPRPESLLYRRFIDALGKIAPLSIVTTNIDEALEQTLPQVPVYQRSDLTGCVAKLQAGASFIGKLHGSRSSIESAVFTSKDYEKVKTDPSYIGVLRHLFSVGTVIFLGYGVGDQYLIDLLAENDENNRLFGAGPHFVVATDFKGPLSLRRVGYSIKRFPDHRSALTVLDFIRQVEQRRIEVSATSFPNSRQLGTVPIGLQTRYYISDFLPPGTWTNSQTAQFEAKDGIKAEMTVGLGFTNEEVPIRVSTAAHDLLVGLICFDQISFPLSVSDRVFNLLGHDMFWRLSQDEIIGFIHLLHQPAVVGEAGSLFGDIGVVVIGDPNANQVEETIRRIFKPGSGKEAAAEELISGLVRRTALFDEGGKIDLAGMVRDSTLMPEVSRLLGIGEAIAPTQIPAWLKFPYLRIAHLVHLGAVCDRFGFHAAKIPFGGVRLTSAAFGVQQGVESAESCASYVVSGRYGSDLGAVFFANPEILTKALRFRETTEGIAFRREIRDQLLKDEAKEFSASVNAGLAMNIPSSVLQRSRDKFSSLLTENLAYSPVPAVWADTRQSDDTTRLWRARSRMLLSELTKKRGIGKDDPCICGSGDKLRLCCLAALRD
jgi:hypothetical protein